MHNLNFNAKKGTYSFAATGEKAWHGLGQMVETAMTAEEAIKLANLDYTVEKAPIYAGINSEIPKIQEVPDVTEDTEEIPDNIILSPFRDKVATYRTDTNEVLGIVGNRYEIVQNKDAFTFFDSILDSKEAIFETAGSLGKGEQIFVTAKLPDDILVKGEAIEKYLILTNSHHGGSAVIAGFTNIRVVCENTLQAALSGKLDNKVSIRHINGAKDRLAEAHRVMGIASKYMDEVQDVFNAMSQKTLSDEEMKEFIEKIFTPKLTGTESEQLKEELSTRTKNVVNSTLEFALSHPTQQTESTRGTVFGAYNSISGYYNYIKKYPNAEAKFQSMQFGLANNRIKEAFTLAKNYLS